LKYSADFIQKKDVQARIDRRDIVSGAILERREEGPEAVGKKSAVKDLGRREGRE